MNSIFTFEGLDFKAIVRFLKDLPGASVYAIRK